MTLLAQTWLATSIADPANETITTANATAASIYANVVIPDGSPEGEYTISARVNYDH